MNMKLCLLYVLVASAMFAQAPPTAPDKTAVVGTVGPIPPTRMRTLQAEGVPADAIVGVHPASHVRRANAGG